MPGNAEHVEILDRHIRTSAERLGLPGLAVAVVRDGELVLQRCLGWARPAEREPVTARTAFRLGSISKILTALAVMQLHEQGALDLDEGVGPRLSTLRIASPEPITFRHLLTHTSGIGTVRSLRDVVRGSERTLGVRAGTPPPSLADYYAPALRPATPPGQRFSYTNHGFAVLGQAVEDTSGMPFRLYLLERLLRPLGMQGTDFEVGAEMQDRLAQDHRSNGRPAKRRDPVLLASMGMLSSLQDMTLFVLAMLGRGFGVVEPSTLERMWRPHYQLDPRLPSMGLGFMLDTFGSHRVAWHGGLWDGFMSALFIAPDANAGLVILTNRRRPVVGFGAELMKVVLGVPSEAPRGAGTEIEARVCGRYGPPSGVSITTWERFGVEGSAKVFAKAGRLYMRNPAYLGGAVPLNRLEGDALLFSATRAARESRVLFRDAPLGETELIIDGLTLLRRRR